MTIREALFWSLGWIFLALCFNGYIYYAMGQTAALQFFIGYLIEKALSLDNLIVIAFTFSYFKVPAQYQRKVLYLGILGALVMRLIFILVGTALIEKFHAVFYLLGLFLIYTGIKFFFEKPSKKEVGKNFLVMLLRKWFPVTKEYHDGHFFIKRAGKWFATPLCIVVLAIEYVDVIFAVDSLPAIFAITLDPFIIYTSNVFAILGLRSLYFVLSASLKRFRHLKKGLACLLVLIGLKMLLSLV